MNDSLDQARLTVMGHDARRDTHIRLRAALPWLKDLVTRDPESWTASDRLLVRAAIHYLTADLEDDDLADGMV